MFVQTCEDDLLTAKFLLVLHIVDLLWLQYQLALNYLAVPENKIQWKSYLDSVVFLLEHFNSYFLQSSTTLQNGENHEIEKDCNIENNAIIIKKFKWKYQTNWNIEISLSKKYEQIIKLNNEM